MNDDINHPYIRQYKEQTGFNQWSLIREFKCNHTGKILKSVVNWHGPIPRGGFYCPHCNNVVSIR